MQNKRAMLVFLCTLCMPLPSPATASDDMFGIMFRMMLTMMNVMSDAMDDDTGGFNNWGLNNWDMGGSSSLGMTTLPVMSGMTGMNPWGMGMSPWSYAMPGTAWGNPLPGGVSPWMAPGAMSSPLPGTGFGLPAFNRGRGGVPGSYRTQGQGASLLAGKWYGNSGEILEIRGNRFRLQAGKTAITGVIRIENNIVNLFSPQTGTITRYTFMRNQTDLILQDAAGKLLGFHKRPLQRGGYIF